MRFLFFAAQYIPTVGGVERYTYNLTKALATAGHSITIVTSELRDLPSEEKDGNIAIIRLPAYLPLNGRLPLLKKNRKFRRLAKKIFENKYDLAVINTRFYPLSLFASKQCGKRTIRAIVIEHGSGHLSLGNPFINFFVHIYEHIAIKRVYRFCEDFYGVSLSCTAWLEHFKITAKGVIYNAIDVAGVSLLAGRSSFNVREQFRLADKTVAVFSGRFLKEKGILELLEAFRYIGRSEDSVVLVMAGDGPLFSETAENLPDNVYLTGQLPYADSLALLKQSDLFILPTYSEGFSTVTLEAAAFGKLIITTPTGGNNELISSMKSGILLEEISAEAIAEAVRFALRNPEFRESCGNAVKQTVESGFNWAVSAEKIVSITGKIGE